MTLKPRDKGREIAVKAGAVLVVELPANHTTDIVGNRTVRRS
jgi:hypothetical protein